MGLQGFKFFSGGFWFLVLPLHPESPSFNHFQLNMFILNHYTLEIDDLLKVVDFAKAHS